MWVGTNTNLGLILLLSPLAKACADDPKGPLEKAAVATCLQQLTRQDAADVYQAIRMASPGGLGSADRYDVHGDPPEDLLVAMQEASDRDLIAAQYVRSFVDVFDFVAPAICESLQRGWSLTESVIHTHVQTMARYPDSLIARKCGAETACKAAALAAEVLRHPAPSSPEYLRGLSTLDFWLRSDGHRRNPGTTADMIGAGLFVCLANQWLPLPTSRDRSH